MGQLLSALKRIEARNMVVRPTVADLAEDFRASAPVSVASADVARSTDSDVAEQSIEAPAEAVVSNITAADDGPWLAYPGVAKAGEPAGEDARQCTLHAPGEENLTRSVGSTMRAPGEENLTRSVRSTMRAPREEKIERSERRGAGPAWSHLARDPEARAVAACAAVKETTPRTPPTSQPEPVVTIAPDTADEPAATLPMPHLGRIASQKLPPRPAAEATSSEEGVGCIPFVSAAQRPYRQACENILGRLPTSGRGAIALVSVDDDLDHCGAIMQLAEVMAGRLDDPVLLVDVSPQGALAQHLGGGDGSRVAAALAGFTPWTELVVQTGTAGLCLLPAEVGEFEQDAVAVARLVEACKQNFGLVIVAGGPASALPENLSAACDFAVLLVELGHTSTAAAVAAIDRLRGAGTEVAGCLVCGDERAV